MKIVIKVGSSSLTDERGMLLDVVFQSLAVDVAALRQAGHEVTIVTSGAVAAGMGVLALAARPSDVGDLQALAAVGQPALIERWASAFSSHEVAVGQVLVTAADFGHRKQYLHARETLARLAALGVIPLVNENDTIASDELRYGDNDRIAALVAHMTQADLLILFTDTDGVFTADPRRDQHASLIDEIQEVDEVLEQVAGGAGSERGSGGMATKLVAARIAAWSGVRTVITKTNPGAAIAIAGGASLGTSISARPDRLSARKLWIAFACEPCGSVTIDDGAVAALSTGGRSLLPAGISGVSGTFEEDDAVEVRASDGRLVAKGIARLSSNQIEAARGRSSSDLPRGSALVAIHRDDLVMLEK